MLYQQDESYKATNFIRKKCLEHVACTWNWGMHEIF